MPYPLQLAVVVEDPVEDEADKVGRAYVATGEAAVFRFKAHDAVHKLIVICFLTLRGSHDFRTRYVQMRSREGARPPDATPPPGKQTSP